MDQIRLMKAMKASISEVLETMFFMVINVVSEGAKTQSLKAENNTISVALDFGGPAHGCFRLTVPSVLAREISADFLGVDVGDLKENDVHGTLMEMINMLAGNTLSHYDADMVFDLSVPRVIGDAGDDSSSRGRTESCHLDIQTLANQILMTAQYEDNA